MKKKTYEHPDIDVVNLYAEDILVTSDDFDDNQGEWDELFSK